MIMCKCPYLFACAPTCTCECHKTGFSLFTQPLVKPSYTGVADVINLDTYRRCMKMGYEKRAAIDMARFKPPTAIPTPEFITPIPVKKEMA